MIGYYFLRSLRFDLVIAQFCILSFFLPLDRSLLDSGDLINTKNFATKSIFMNQNVVSDSGINFSVYHQ